MLHRTDQDVAFWLQLAHASGGPVLELACGTGRITVPLAIAGVEMVGLDNDGAMLDAALRRARQLRAAGGLVFLAGDMRRFALARRFRLVFVGYNSFQLLTGPGDMAACLNTAREHLASGGRIGLEVTDFQLGGADGPDGVDGGSSLMLLGEAEGIRLSGTLIHDVATRTSRYRRRFEGSGWQLESDLVIRSLDQRELEDILGAAGLSVVRLWTAGTTTRAVAAVGRSGAD